MRRPNNHLFEKLVLVCEHEQVTGDTTLKVWQVPPGRKLSVDRVLYVNPTGLAEHADNHFTISLKNGATVVATTTTDADAAGADNSIAANTFVELDLDESVRLFEAGDDLDLLLDEGGTATLPAGKLLVECRLI